MLLFTVYLRTEASDSAFFPLGMLFIVRQGILGYLRIIRFFQMILQLPEIVNETVGQGTFSKSWQFSFFVRSLIRGQTSVDTTGGAVIGTK